MKDMVHALVLAGFFISCQISCIFHNHDLFMVSLRIGTDRTQFLISQRKAFFAISDIRSRAGHRTRKLFYLILGHIDDVKRQALG